MCSKQVANLGVRDIGWFVLGHELSPSNPPSVVKLTAFFAPSNCGRWIPPLRLATIPSCWRLMQPTRV